MAIIAANFPHIREPLTNSAMQPQSTLERDVASMIVATLNLETVTPEQIDPAEPLFGTGLGLDSIDALELALEISKRYGFQLRSDDEDNRRIFASLANLAAHIEQHRVK